MAQQETTHPGSDRGTGRPGDRPHEGGPPSRPVSRETTREVIVTPSGRAPRWSGTPARVVGLVAGILFLVLGIVALARAGLAGIGTDLTDPHVVVGAWHLSPLHAILQVVLGLMLLAGASSPVDVGSLVVLGGVSLVAGLVLLIETGAFHGWLGVHRPAAWLYLGAGVVTLVAGFAGTEALRP